MSGISRRRNVTDLKKLGPGSLISRFEAKELLAELVPDTEDDPRQTKDKVDQRLKYAIRLGHLSPSASNADLFALGEIVAWAHTKWPGRIADLPSTARIVPLAGNETVVSDSTLSVHVRLANLASCHEALDAAHKKIELLEQQLLAAREEIEKLTPLAAKRQLMRAKNQENARKPRKGI